ncbi:hypothetical protein FRC06_001643 [Ceratobasidium sp. 370]|nr:hypothetical protein FRC06_001643 [Ceratobasidium sp. 370]
MKLQLKQLEYSRTNYFTIPYLTHAFYVATFCLLVALVGSDIVTTLRSDPTVDENPWWMPKYWPKALLPRTIPQICQPVSITDDVPLRTNSSVPLFKYILRHASVAGVGIDPSNRIYPAPYMGNPLQNCEVTSIALNMELPIEIMTYTFTVHCSLGGKKEYSFRIPDNVTFTTSYQRTFNGDLGPDDMINYLAFNAVPAAATIFKASPTLKALPYNSTSPMNVLGVLDAIQSDLFKAIWVQTSRFTYYDMTYNTTHIIEWAAGSLCTSGSNSTELTTPCDSITDPRRLIRWYESTGGQIYDPVFMQDFNITLSNVFITLRDALMLDLGNIDPTSNIYLNKSYFDSSIQTDPFFASALPIVTTMVTDYGPITPYIYWESCTWGWNCVNTTSWANALRSTPENVPVNNLVLPWKPGQELLSRPSVLSFSYLCPTLQKKPTGSLLTGVFVATATMLGVAYSIFQAVMPKVERRYLMKKAAQGRIMNPNDEDRQDALAFITKGTRDSSQTIYDQVPVTELPYKYDGYEYPYSGGDPAVSAGPYSYSTQNVHGH